MQDEGRPLLVVELLHQAQVAPALPLDGRGQARADPEELPGLEREDATADAPEEAGVLHDGEGLQEGAGPGRLRDGDQAGGPVERIIAD